MVGSFVGGAGGRALGGDFGALSRTKGGAGGRALGGDFGALSRKVTVGDFGTSVPRCVLAWSNLYSNSIQNRVIVVDSTEAR